ncbi:hypothetical protein RQP46_006076 [Phenoliferia psychrophenolica]
MIEILTPRNTLLSDQSELPVTPALTKGEATRTSAVGRAWTWVTSSILSPIAAEPVTSASAPSPTSRRILATRRAPPPTLSTLTPTSTVSSPAAVVIRFDVAADPSWPVPSPTCRALERITEGQELLDFAIKYWAWRDRKETLAAGSYITEASYSVGMDMSAFA